jgi:outer membrane lipoprotein-sorting protein
MISWCMAAVFIMGVGAAEPTLVQLLDAADDYARGDSSHATIEMAVKTKRYERTMRMESWSKGTDASLIRILSPAKDAGITTLMRDENVWNYLPKVDRTLKGSGGDDGRAVAGKPLHQ